MSPDDLGQKLELLKEQTRTKSALLEKRHEERKQEILLQNQLKALGTTAQGETSIEVIKLQHDLDVDVRQRDRDDTLFYKDLDLQEFIKKQQLTQSHLLEEIQHTTVSTILEKAILMIVSARLDDSKRSDVHLIDKDKKTHDTTEQMRLEAFRSELAVKYGEDKAEEILSVLERNIDAWEQEATD